MAWCKATGAPSPFEKSQKPGFFHFFGSKKTIFSRFHYDREVRGACPVIFVKYGIFPKPSKSARQAGFCVFPEKKLGGNRHFVPGPQCRPEPGSGRPACIFFRRDFWILHFYDEKVQFLGSKNDQKPRFSDPDPNVHQNRSGPRLPSEKSAAAAKAPAAARAAAEARTLLVV